MKKVLLICFVLIGSILQAQPGPDRSLKDRKEMKEKMAELEPQQRAELKAKKMTLHLNLSETQQNQIKSLLVEREKRIDLLRAQRKEKKEITEDEIFTRRSERLDEEIAFKKELQSILTEEQFAKFEKSRMKRGKMKKRPGKRKKE